MWCRCCLLCVISLVLLLVIRFLTGFNSSVYFVRCFSAVFQAGQATHVVNSIAFSFFQLRIFCYYITNS